MLDRISTKIFADGADLDGILRLAADPLITGFTTNPTLMWKAGLTDYADFAQRLLEQITRQADLLRGLRRRRGRDPPAGHEASPPGARTSTSRSRSRRPAASRWRPLVRELSEDGVQVNVTALFTAGPGGADHRRGRRRRAGSCISVFAGRIADAGVDPIPIMQRSVDIIDRRAARRADLGQPARGPQPRAGRSGRLPHHHDDPRPAAEGQEPRQGSRPVLARDRPDVPPRRSGRRLLPLAPAACGAPSSPAVPGSSAAPWPTASLDDGVEVAILDDFRTGRQRVHRRRARARRATCSRATSSTAACCDAAIAGCDTVFHLQANADVRHGLEHPRRDLEQNTIATSNVLEAMRAAGAQRIGFSSTGSVYGDARRDPDARGRRRSRSRPRCTPPPRSRARG